MNASLRKELLPPAVSYRMQWEAPTPLITPMLVTGGRDPYTFFIDQMLRNIIPHELLAALGTGQNKEAIEHGIEALNEQAPLVSFTSQEDNPLIVTATLLCPSEMTCGSARSLTDVLCRWLIPGQLLTTLSTHSLHFKFAHHPTQQFFFQQVALDLRDIQYGRPLHNLDKLSQQASRFILFHYLFRKFLKSKRAVAPQERHLCVKLFSASHCELGIFGAVNMLNDKERVEKRHILDAVQRLIPHAKPVPGSCILDHNSQENICIFYLEVKKNDTSSFSKEELKQLRRDLPMHIQENIQEVFHPVFMPRNEEEIMRNIMMLSQQLNYLRDLPQVMISFNLQQKEELIFTIVLLRILKSPNDPTILSLCANAPFTIEGLESKKVGKLRTKIKEANVFTIKLNKHNFVRSDFSLNIFKARQYLSHTLNQLLGGIRDFNGGILSKQQEVLASLQQSIEEQYASLLETFFYSLSPALHQSLLSPQILQKLFLLLIEATKKKSPFFKTVSEKGALLIMVGTTDPLHKQKIQTAVAKLEIPSSSLCSTVIQTHGMYCIGYLYQTHDIAAQQTLLNILL